jgi:hypothetical protein
VIQIGRIIRRGGSSADQVSKRKFCLGATGISPETPGVARIKIARSTLAPHLGMTLYASRAEQEKQIYFEIEWTRASFIDVKFFLLIMFKVCDRIISGSASKLHLAARHLS